MKESKWEKIKGENTYHEKHEKHENETAKETETEMADTYKTVNENTGMSEDNEEIKENVAETEDNCEANPANEAPVPEAEEKHDGKKKNKEKSGHGKSKDEDVTITKEEAKEILDKFQELNDKYLHVVAEYDNYRKRAQKEKEGAYADAYADVLKEILPSVDNLERAVSFGDDAKIGEGVTMTLNQFSAALTKLGIEAFGEAGEKFDPQIHNAVMHVEDESLEDNIITDVFQKGYKKGDRIIRFAMVKVAN